ncbi:MAG: hypothetical protein QXN87_01995 [Candidatus Bathyarchaeia archaeon]
MSYTEKQAVKNRKREVLPEFSPRFLVLEQHTSPVNDTPATCVSEYFGSIHFVTYLRPASFYKLGRIAQRPRPIFKKIAKVSFELDEKTKMLRGLSIF